MKLLRAGNAIVGDVALFSAIRIGGLLLNLLVLTPLLIAKYGVDGFAAFSSVLSIQFLMSMVDSVWLANIKRGHIPQLHDVGKQLATLSAGTFLVALFGVLAISTQVSFGSTWAFILVAGLIGLYPLSSFVLRHRTVTGAVRPYLALSYAAWAMSPVLAAAMALSQMPLVAVVSAWLIPPVLVGFLVLPTRVRNQQPSEARLEFRQFWIQPFLQQPFVFLLQVLPILLLTLGLIQSSAQAGLLFRLAFPIVAFDGMLMNSLMARRASIIVSSLIWSLFPALFFSVCWSICLLVNHSQLLNWIARGEVLIPPWMLLAVLALTLQSAVVSRIAVVSRRMSHVTGIVGLCILCAAILEILVQDNIEVTLIVAGLISQSLILLLWAANYRYRRQELSTDVRE